MVIRPPQRPQMMMPWSRAGPSRGGPAARSRPCAAALADSLAMLASYWSRGMYPGWPPGEGQPGGADPVHDGGGRPGGLERGGQVPERALDGGVGVEDDVPGGV